MSDLIEQADRSPLLADLTEPQKQAVMHTEGPVLVLAAAGSGKTRVITRRAAYLVRQIGLAPWNLLCITFTNKAAGEMRQRIGQLLSEGEARRMMICTFHSLCARLLRQYHEPAGLHPDFVIYDSSDQSRAMKQAFKDLDISSNHFTPDAILSSVSTAKNQLIDADQFAAGAGDFFSKTVARLYRAYQAILDRSHAVDFDDLLLKMARLLQHHEPSRVDLQQRFQYVQIDEYQDTNHSQFVIAHTLAAGHQNLCVVGDPDQSIYGWRGANIRNILDFKKHYPAATVIELGQNYRSTPEILSAADSLIRCNRQRIAKKLFTENPSGDKIKVVQAADEEHEASIVVDYLRDMQNRGVQFGEMGIFFRVNALTRVIEAALLQSSIPYVVARGTAFYERKEVKDALAYLRVLANPNDEIAVKRIINVPARGIGDTTVDHLDAYAIANGLSLWNALEKASMITALTPRASNAIGRFVRMIEQWREKMNSADSQSLGFVPGIRDVIEMILRDSGLEKLYKEGDEENEQQLANLQELVTAGQRFDDQYAEDNAQLPQRVRDYLEHVSLMSDVDALTSHGGGAVTLMTLHAAKGLEFPVVAMIGLEERLLPHNRAMNSASELEEERRLCFVGITRAQKHLMMTHARYRTIRGLRERTVPSQFLREIGSSVVEIEDRSQTAASPWDDFETAGRRAAMHDYEPPEDEEVGGGSGEWSVGLLVKHPQFGLGRIMSLSPAGAPDRAKVQFQRFGIKTLVLEYARLEKVDETF